MEFALIAGIITAAVGATSGLLGSIQNDVEAYQKAEAQGNYIDALYLKQKEQAKLEFDKAKEDAEKNAARAEQQADLTDLSTDITEKSASNDINSAIDNLYLSEASDTWSWNNAAMQAGSSEGSALASVAGSGIRAGSSLSDAVQMESAVNASQLQFNQDATRRGNDNNLASVLNSIAGTKVNIQANRIGADNTRLDAMDLRNSFLEGGYNYNIYQNQNAQLDTKYNYDKWQINKEKENHSGWNAFWNGFLAMHTMGAKGFQSGYSIGDTVYKSATYKTTTGSGN